MPTWTWFARNGNFELNDDGSVTFPGGIYTDETGKAFTKFVNLVCNGRLTNGKVSATIQFTDVTKPPCAAIIVREVPEKSDFLIGGIGVGGAAAGVQVFSGSAWLQPLAVTGEWSAVRANYPYRLEVELTGARLTLYLDGIRLLQLVLPSTSLASHVGLWMQSEAPITVKEFNVLPSPRTAFVVMQFSEQYDKLFSDVIKPTCKKYQIEAERADHITGPGFILEDITKRLIEATITIAEVTPSNPNVFFEVGYAYAHKRPLILIAERGRGTSI